MADKDNAPMVASLQPSETGDQPPTGFGSPLQELRYLILAVQREGNRWLSEMLRAADLTPAQAEVISILADREPLTLSGLGKLLICETGSPSRLVNSLVQKGFVAQDNHQTDRRAKLFYLTPNGKATLALIHKTEEEIDGFLSALLSDQEIKYTRSSLYKLLGGTAIEQAMLRRFGYIQND